MKKEFIVERDGRNFVLYTGLLDLAHERGLKGITTTLVQVPNEVNGMLAICHATVETEQGTFTGLGDASPSNVNRLMAPHLIRMAETRAKARALRDAVNVGVTALEELADTDEPDEPQPEERRPAPANRPATPARRELRSVDAAGAPEDEADETRDERARANGRAEGAQPVRLGFGVPGASESGPGGRAAQATPKQLQTITRMARAAGKQIDTEGLTRAQASEIISNLIGEMGQLRAS
ncbi:MAG: hypothetical protein ACRDI2_18275 [Chloroflexota bacterium]